jgi:hypothetical protein
MKVIFTASLRGKKYFESQYKALFQEIEKLGYEHMADDLVNPSSNQVYVDIKQGGREANIALYKKNMEDTDDLLQKIMGQLPASLKRDPEEVILSFIPPSPQEISHSELFTKAYSSNRELKSLTFKQIIQNLIDKNQIYTRKDGRAGKHQTLYSLAS